MKLSKYRKLRKICANQHKTNSYENKRNVKNEMKKSLF